MPIDRCTQIRLAWELRNAQTAIFATTDARAQKPSWPQHHGDMLGTRHGTDGITASGYAGEFLQHRYDYLNSLQESADHLAPSAASDAWRRFLSHEVRGTHWTWLAATRVEQALRQPDAEALSALADVDAMTWLEVSEGSNDPAVEMSVPVLVCDRYSSHQVYISICQRLARIDDTLSGTPWPGAPILLDESRDANSMLLALVSSPQTREEFEATLAQARERWGLRVLPSSWPERKAKPQKPAALNCVAKNQNLGVAARLEKVIADIGIDDRDMRAQLAKELWSNQKAHERQKKFRHE